MATEQKADYTIHGEIAKLAFINGKQGEYAEVEVLENGSTRPTKAKCFVDALVERLHKAEKGHKVGFEIWEKTGQYKGTPIQYKNIVGIVKYDPDAPPSWKGQPKANGQSSQDASNRYGQRSPDERRSIEKQVSLKAAVEAYGYQHSADDDVATMADSILFLADAFDAWLAKAPADASESTIENGLNE